MTLRITAVLTIICFMALSGAPPSGMAVLAAVPERAEVLMDENFVFPYNPDGESGQTASGWDIDRAGGNAEGQYKTWFRLNDVSASEAVNMSKKLSRSVTDELTLETRLRLNVRADGFSAALTSGGAAPVRVVTQGGSLYCETDGDAAVLLRTYYANDEMGLKIKANVTAHTADIYINGNLCGQGISFSASVASIDGVRFSTGKDAVGMMYISSVQVHSGYAVWDKFVSSVPTAFPASEWTVAGGPASVQNVGGVTVPDLYSMTLGGGAEITKDFSIDALRIVFSFAFYMSSYADASLAKLSDGVVDVLEIVTRGDGIYLRASNGNLSNKVDFRNNLWYNIKMIIDLSESTLDLSVNGKQTAIAGEPLLNAAETVNRLVFSADGEAGNVWIDDIAVYPDEPLPADYVPLPVKAVSDRLVGIQSCSLWREGNHLGWDRINGYPERKPLLGYYDEGSPEAADWEIKWLAEHGISFEMYCWYRPSAAGGGSVAKPIKDPYMSQGLHNGYFNAKYSDMIDFMIMWENSASMAAGSADFRTNILPFWIEYYLKDPRYLRVGNKPVISFMNVDRLIVDFGSLQAVREETDYIRQTCVDLGFDGAVLMTAYSGSDALALTKIADAGIDCVYSYSWGQLSGDAEYQKMRMAAQRDAGANIVPTLSMGRNDAAWGGVSGSYAPPADFARLAAWAKNEFMTSLPPSSIGAEMVLLDNWNEFGEGHFMMPAETFGFGYLDAVRNVFTSGGAHTDTIPDANQKARLNRLYDAERRMTPRRKEEKPIQLYKKTAWNFNTDGDSEGWGPCANVSGLTASGGVFGGNSLNADPSVQSVDSLDIDITDSSYITVKMRNGTNSAAAQIYFQLMGDTVFTEGKSVQFIINGNDGNYTEYVVDMSANANWTGRLKRLRLDPCMAAGNFSVDFIGISGGAIKAGNNLINDGSFENGGVPGDVALQSVTSSEFKHGFRSLRVDGENGGGVRLELPIEGLENWQSFYYSVWLKLPPGEDVTNRAALSVICDMGGAAQWAGESDPLSDVRWTQLSGVYTVDLSAWAAPVRLYIESDASGIYVDNIEIRALNVDTKFTKTWFEINGPVSLTVGEDLGVALTGAQVFVDGAPVQSVSETGGVYSVTFGQNLENNRRYSLIIKNPVSSDGQYLPYIRAEFQTMAELEALSRGFYTDYGGAGEEKLTQLNGFSQTATSAAKIQSHSSDEIQIWFITVLYEDGRIAGVWRQSRAAGPFSEETFALEINLNPLPGKSYRLAQMLWRGDTLEPYIDVEEIV